MRLIYTYIFLFQSALDQYNRKQDRLYILHMSCESIISVLAILYPISHYIRKQLSGL